MQQRQPGRASCRSVRQAETDVRPRPNGTTFDAQRAQPYLGDLPPTGPRLEVAVQEAESPGERRWVSREDGVSRRVQQQRVREPADLGARRDVRGHLVLAARRLDRQLLVGPLRWLSSSWTRSARSEPRVSGEGGCWGARTGLSACERTGSSGMCGGPATEGPRARTTCDPHCQKACFTSRFEAFRWNRAASAACIKPRRLETRSEMQGLLNMSLTLAFPTLIPGS